MDIQGLKQDTILKGKSHTYRIVRTLGSGSFGITYLADILLGGESSHTPFKVTIKEFFMKDLNGREGNSVTSGSKEGYFGKYLDKFIQEADKLSKIESRGVVKVLESFQANNTAYYVMQYLSGGSLNDLISRHLRIPERYALQLCLQIASALKDIHAQHMLHLDLKPSNVMLSAAGDAVLIDFGLSKQYNEHGEPESSTTIGAGTRGYAPIEQANYKDGHDFPVTMDIYALGATLYKMLCGVVPPDSSSILNDGFPSGVLQQAGASSIVVSFVEHLMSPLKKGRPQSMLEVIGLINTFGPQTNLADRNELIRWINPHEQKNDTSRETEESDINDETEVEVLSANEKHFDSCPVASFDSEVNKVEIKLISEPSSRHNYIWFSLSATPDKLVLTYLSKDDQSATKKTFFFNPIKFNALKQQLEKLDLHCRSNGDSSSSKQTFGINVKTFRHNIPEFYATTFDDGLPTPMLDGKIRQLSAFAWKMSGLLSINHITSGNNPLSKIVRFLISPHKWLWCLVVLILVSLVYSYKSPLSKYFDNHYRHEVIRISSVNASPPSYYQLRADQGGKGGVYYMPSNTWVIAPTYKREYDSESYSNQSTYIPNDSFSLPGVRVLTQKDVYALINEQESTNLFFKGELIATFPLADDGSISIVHPNLYKIRIGRTNQPAKIAIYNNSGNPVIPFSKSFKNVIGDNEIEVWESGAKEYFDISGNPIGLLNPVVFYDRFTILSNLIAILIITALICMVGKLGFNFLKKKNLFHLPFLQPRKRYTERKQAKEDY